MEQRWMLVSCGSHRLALPASAVREVVPARPFTRLPGAPDAVPGVVNLRGRMVTVVDLAAHLGLPPASASGTHRVVVLSHGTRQLGVAVDDVLRIVTLTDEELSGATEVEDTSFLIHAATAGAESFRTVDIAALLHPLFG